MVLLVFLDMIIIAVKLKCITIILILSCHTIVSAGIAAYFNVKQRSMFTRDHYQIIISFMFEFLNQKSQLYQVIRNCVVNFQCRKKCFHIKS